MPITSTHSFYCKAFGLEAASSDLGNNLGAALNLFTSDDYASRITLYLDDVAYARALAEAINTVGKKFFLDDEPVKVAVGNELVTLTA